VAGHEVGDAGLEDLRAVEQSVVVTAGVAQERCDAYVDGSGPQVDNAE
jgi:hypothetical protein